MDSNRLSTIPNQVAFRIDFPVWLNRQSPRNKRIAERLAIGYSTREVAHEFQISRARVSQLRRELAESWDEFVDSNNTRAKSATT